MDALRIGDAEREQVVALLGEHYALGRLSHEEYDERSDAAWSARTQRDLSLLFADLPAAARAPGPGDGRALVRGRRRWVGPRVLLGVFALLVAASMITHLPLVLIGVGLWLVVGRRRLG